MMQEAGAFHQEVHIEYVSVFSLNPLATVHQESSLHAVPSEDL